MKYQVFYRKVGGWQNRDIFRLIYQIIGCNIHPNELFTAKRNLKISQTVLVLVLLVLVILGLNIHSKWAVSHYVSH